MPPLKTWWVAKVSSSVGASLLMVDGILFAPTLDGRIFALDPLQKKVRGKYRLKGRIEGTCVAYNRDLIVALRFGTTTLFRLNPLTSDVVWRTKLGPIASEPLLVGNRLYVTTLQRGVYALEAESGRIIWHQDLEASIRSSPALSQDYLVFGDDKGLLRALDPRDGHERWRFKAEGALWATPIIADTLVLIGDNRHYFYAVGLFSGRLKWQVATGGRILRPASIYRDWVIFASNDWRLYAVDRNSGTIVWTYDTGSVVGTAPLVVGEVIYVGLLNHHFCALKASTGEKLWDTKLKGRVRTTPIVWNDFLIVASEDRYIYFFRPERKKGT